MVSGEQGAPIAAEVTRPADSCVVYTALFGDYEALQEQPGTQDSSAHFVCFTDNPSLTSTTWEVRLVEAAFPGDPIRSARLIKIQGHPSLADYGYSVWVDNRVTLERDPVTICEKLLVAEEADIALFQHSFRERVIDEFDAVARGGYDDPARVYEQLMHYADSCPDVLQQKPLWTGFLVRRNCAPLNAAMRVWSQQVLRYSRRDQLSVNLALQGTGVRVHELTGSNRQSEFHVWPPLSPSLGRSVGSRSRSILNAIEPPLARLRAIERDSADLLAAHQSALGKKDELIGRLNRQVDQQKALLAKGKKSEAVLRGRLTRVRARLDDRNERIHVLRGRVQRLRSQNARLQEQVGAPRVRPPAALARRGAGKVLRVVRNRTGR